MYGLTPSANSQVPNRETRTDCEQMALVGGEAWVSAFLSGSQKSGRKFPCQAKNSMSLPAPTGEAKIGNCLAGFIMAKRVKASRIKKNLTYSIIEAAEELGLSTATIRNWIKQGLHIQKDQRPYLIYGCDLRDFVSQKNTSRKFTLAAGELNCFTCKAGRMPLGNAVIYTPQTAKTGRLSGICSACGGKCARIISNAKISKHSQILKIQFSNGRTP